MTTPLFPSVIGWNLLDGGTDAQDGNNYPGPALQDYAAAVVGAGAVGVISNGSEFSLDSVFPRTDTEFPAERVSLSASGCACASPCQIERIRCVTGTSVALVVYDNPAVSSGTQLYSGTLSAGQEAEITIPIRAINGARAVFASGSFDLYISQEI